MGPLSPPRVSLLCQRVAICQSAINDQLIIMVVIQSCSAGDERECSLLLLVYKHEHSGCENWLLSERPPPGGWLQRGP